MEYVRGRTDGQTAWAEEVAADHYTSVTTEA